MKLQNNKVKVVIKISFSQMEVCQTGYNTEDFRTQEVPAGFDFASYGEFGVLHDMALDMTTFHALI